MAPTASKRTTRGRRPLATSTPTSVTNVVSNLPNLVELFDASQHETSSDATLNQIKQLYKITNFEEFQQPFKDCIERLLHCKHTIYFKRTCEFVCRFLQHLSKLSDEIKSKERDNTVVENTVPSQARKVTVIKKRTPARKAKRGRKRKTSVTEDDELVPSSCNLEEEESSGDDELLSENIVDKRKSISSQIGGIITNHDRIISSFIEVVDYYMDVADEECRLNALFLVCKFLTYVESLDEEICQALKRTFFARIRDKKPTIRAQAVLASRIFQDDKVIKESFMYHFERDPDLVVRKALLQIMDPKVFGYDFLVSSTRDIHEQIRKIAYQRLGKVDPKELNSSQIHQVIQNGLNERNRQIYSTFKTFTSAPWLKLLYDGLDLLKLLEKFDVLKNNEDVCRLLDVIYANNHEELLNNGATTQLHRVVESFKERWLKADNLCLPLITEIDEKIITIWMTLFKFCKKNQNIIKSVKIRHIQQANEDDNESIEETIDSQEDNDEVVDLYERLVPDLINLIDFLRRFIQYSVNALEKNEAEVAKLEYIYQELMEFISTYDVADELERKAVQEVLEDLLKESFLTGKFNNFISPIVKCLYKLVYTSNSNFLINYISEMISNVQSYLEDLVSSTTHVPTQLETLSISTIPGPRKSPRVLKKMRLSEQGVVRSSRNFDNDEHNLELRMANIRLNMQELNDKKKTCIDEEDFDQAKIIKNELDKLKRELELLRDRRLGLASDVSRLSMDHDGNADKLSSTVLDGTLDESRLSDANQEEVRIFKMHTNELLRCLQMYFACLQNVKTNNIPQTMLNHLKLLTFESLDEWFNSNSRVRSLMIACNGLTALYDKEFAKNHVNITLLMAACKDKSSIEVRTVAIQSIVDIICQHQDMEFPMNEVELHLDYTLKDYGKYDPDNGKENEFNYLSALIKGAAKLYYYKKLTNPAVLSHIIIWWYHPKTDSKLRQFIGLYLPVLVEHLTKLHLSNAGKGGEDEVEEKGEEDGEKLLSYLLKEVFVTSIEMLHEYILRAGFDFMTANDIQNLINFLCNLIPQTFHEEILHRVEKEIDDLTEGEDDLLKFLKYSKNCLTSSISANQVSKLKHQ